MRAEAAFVQDRLTKDELDMRVSQALASRTYADLAAVTADIPPGWPQPSRHAPGHRIGKRLTRG